MKNKTQKIIVATTVVLTTLALVSTTKINASNTLQSKGKLIYTDPETGEELVIDTADHQLMLDELNDIERRLGGLKFGVDENGNCGYIDEATGKIIPF